jgi:hypothetical protein
VAQVDGIVPVKPERGRHCQQPVPGEDRQPQRQQVTEIPPVKPVITADQLHPLVCSACGAATRAEVPPGVATGGFGPRVQASITLGTGASHRSPRTPHTVLPDLCGVSRGVGTIAHLAQATVRAVAEPVAEARADVPPRRRGPCALGGALLGVCGAGSLEGVPRVAALAAAAVLGPSGARSGGDGGAGGPLPSHGGSVASPGPPDVAWVASGARRHAGAGECRPR